MKRKEKEAYWSAKIDEYQNSGLALSEWCETTEVAVHSMKYWLRKQSPVNHTALQETSWVSCVVEESIENSISLKVNHVDIKSATCALHNSDTSLTIREHAKCKVN